jgi:uncharacterized protein YqcC (DUF446 family)
MINTEAVRQKIDAIENEMKRIGEWQNDPLPDEAYDIQEAFGTDKMSLSQWLQFIFIPKVRELLETNGPWPELSQVGTYAAREYLFLQPLPSNPQEYSTQGSVDQKELELVKLLQEFDSFFTTSA